MKVWYRKLKLALCAVAVLTILPAQSSAQVFWSADAGAGIAMPMGSLSNGAGSGPSFRGGLSYFLSSRLALRGEAGASLMSVKGQTDMMLHLYNYTGGLEYHLTDPTGSTTLAFDATAGVGTFRSDVFTVMDRPTAGSRKTSRFYRSYPAAGLGLTAGFNFARDADTGVPVVTLFLRGGMTMVMAKEEDSADFMALNDQSGFGMAMQLPFTVGLRLNVP